MTLILKRVGIAVGISLTACAAWRWTTAAADYEATKLSDGWPKVSVPDFGMTIKCPPTWRYSKRQDEIEFQSGTEPDVVVRCFTGIDEREFLESCTRLSGYRGILMNGKPALCKFARGHHFGWDDAGYVCRFIALEGRNCAYLIQCRVRYEARPPSPDREAELDALLGSIETSPIDEHLTYTFDDPNRRYSFAYPRNWHISGLTPSSVFVGSDTPGAYVVISEGRTDEQREARNARSVEDIAKDFSGFRWQQGWRHDYVIVRPNGTFRFAITMGELSKEPRMEDTLQILRSFRWHESEKVESNKPQ